MALKKIFANYFGKLKEIANGDFIATAQLGSGSSISTKFLRGDNTWQDVAGGSGWNFTSGTATVSFGAQPDQSASITVASAVVTAAGVKSISFLPETSADHETVEDFAVEGLTFQIENIIDNTSFDIRANATNETWGNYNVKYLIGY